MSVKLSAFFLLLLTLQCYGFYRCGQNEQTCSRNRNCCSGCCYDGLCLTGVACNPCAYTLCARGRVCIPEQVQCIRAPCPPIARCVPPNEDGGNQDPIDPRDDPCSVVRCGYGKQCVVKTLPCFAPPCPQRAECVDPGQSSNNNPLVVISQMVRQFVG